MRAMTLRMESSQRGSNAEARDRALVAAIASADHEALGELYRLYHPRLFKFIFRLIGAYDLADELVNDVMLVIWRGAAKFRGAARVSTWIFGIAYRQAMRRVSRRRLQLVGDVDPDSFAADDGRHIEREDWVRHGIDELPPAQKAAVILVFYQGLSYEEAAAVADCPVNTIKTRMFHARRKLRQLLEQAAEPNRDRTEDDDGKSNGY